jgi:hypothetical protein
MDIGESGPLSLLYKWHSNTQVPWSQVCQEAGIPHGIGNSAFFTISEASPIGNDEDESFGGIHLLTQFFINSDEARMKELLTCLKVNLRNPFIQTVHLLNERIYTDEELDILELPKELREKVRQTVTGHRLTYKDAFDYVSSTNLTGYIVLANLDIFLDDSAQNIRRIGLPTHKKIECLSKFDVKPNQPIKTGSQLSPERKHDSQDAWIWHSNYNLEIDKRRAVDFELGTLGCDNVFIYLMSVFGYSVYNEPLVIKTYHLHNSNVREENRERKKLPPPYSTVAPAKSQESNLKHDCNHSFTFHNENLKFYLLLKGLVEDCLLLGKPFIIPRLAGIEHMFAVIGLNVMKRGRFEQNEANFCNQRLGVMKNNAGVLLNDANAVVKYADEYLGAFHHSDAYFDWEPYGGVARGGVQATFEAVYNMFPKPRFWSFGVLDIFHVIEHEYPWTHALKGSRLLIISPFADLFQKQIEKQERFYGKPIFLDCSFVFIKPPMTQGDTPARPYNVELDEFMVKVEAIKDTFDIALCSCGGYGNPLLKRLYQLGKSAIYVGGVLQMYFGVYGSRWENERASIVKHYIEGNDAWVKPQDADKPLGFEKIEGGCYW